MNNTIKIESETYNIMSPLHIQEIELISSKVDPSSTMPTSTNEITFKNSKNGVLKRKKSIYKNRSCIHKEDKKEFTLHLKKKFLQYFCENGCTPESLDYCIKRYEVDPGEVKEYFSKAAKEAQQYIYQECDSLSFSNTNQWLRYMQIIGAPEESNYEAAIVMNAIANNEQLPDPETIGGINLKSIYKYLSNTLMGLPLPALEPASAKFLSNEFKNLINEANTDEADYDVQNMKTKIELILNTTECPQPTSLDALGINDDSELEGNPIEAMVTCTNNFKIEK